MNGFLEYYNTIKSATLFKRMFKYKTHKEAILVNIVSHKMSENTVLSLFSLPLKE